MRRFALAALIGAATVALTGVALAGSTTTEPGVLYAVVKKADGSMYHSPDGTFDANKETLLSWNVQGIQGPPGPPGAPGAQGPPGPAAESDVTVTRGYLMRGQLRRCDARRKRRSPSRAANAAS